MLSVLAILLALISQAYAQDSSDEKLSFSIPKRGVWSTTTSGTADSLRTGYGRIAPAEGSTTPSGVAIFGFRRDGVLIAEAGVPASEPVRQGRLFAEVSGSVNTGVAFANPNAAPTDVEFYVTDTGGSRLAEGRFTLDAHSHIAKFLNDAPFNAGSGVLGTLTFTSTVPVSVIALRTLTNEAGEVLITTLPVAPFAAGPFASASGDPIYFSHFADGSGWASQVILVNPTASTITGTIEFLGQGTATAAASPAVVTLDDGRSGSSFEYAVAPRSSQRFTTSNPAGLLSMGSVRATPAGRTAAPSGLVVFSFTSDGKTVSEAGVPALPEGTAFRVPVEASGTPGRPGSIRTGLAVANTADVFNTVTLEVTRPDGTQVAPPATITLPPSGQAARMLDEIVSLPADFSGLLRVSSVFDASVIALRSRVNELGELKVTTTPPANETARATSEDRFFAHFADSAGWTTQFILFSGISGQAASGSLRLVDAAGAPSQPPGMAADFDLDSGISQPEGITFANGRFHVIDSSVRKVYAYAASGRRDPAADFDVVSFGSYGITFANGRFHVVSWISDKVYAYQASGRRDPAADFDLGSENDDSRGITFANGRFHVVDGDDTKVYAYSASGRRDPAADFDLDSDNTHPGGVTFANGRFHVVDWIRNKVYAYSASGRRDPASDFDLDSANGFPKGITFANGRFYVVDGIRNKVYAYDASGRRVPGVGGTGAPDLVVQAPSVSDSSPDAGSSFTLRATVRNQGDGSSTATTLRYYRSSNANISTSDSEVGTDAVASLPASGVSAESISLTAPSSAGTYYYGACVAPVSGESDTRNNCSGGVRVTVGGGQMEIESFDLASENRDPDGITFANGRFHVVDGRDEKVYAYQASGRRDSAADFDLDSDNLFPGGITFANGRFYVVDAVRPKVYAYQASGRRDPAADFDLDSDNLLSGGIAFANGRFYVVAPDPIQGKVLAYQTSGRRDPAADFDLDSDNLMPVGITFANSRFYVVEEFSEKVYAHQASGRRDPAADFDLDSDNGYPRGITFANGRFYVVDSLSEKVYAYDASVESPPRAGLAPADEPAFNSRMVGNRIIGSSLSVDFVSDGRFILSGRVPGSYRYSNTGPDAGTVTLTFDFGGNSWRLELPFTFTSATRGSFLLENTSGNWILSEISETGRPPAPLFEDRSGSRLGFFIFDVFERGETRAYDIQAREKTSLEWQSLCLDGVDPGADNDLNFWRLNPFLTNVPTGIHQVRYRHRNSSRCGSGTPGEWSEIGEEGVNLWPF